ncbi:ATP-binding protein [Streptomyces sp. NPDC006339]|uniref:ATP-binding protein n=1 Tax=Streptomyces sp. NPDC006339 TaxID=3156755 RepID=UPI0033AEF13C
MKTRGDARPSPSTPAVAYPGAGPPDATAVRTSAQARRAVRRALASCLPRRPSQVDDLMLVASELVTNAQRHAGGVTAFAIGLGRDSVTISVGDASPRTPQYTFHQELRPGGFGWPIVLHLCRQVLLDVRSDGKTVHAVVPFDR